ncbi:MAG: hypothetical protein KBB91_00800 [Candidatus Pacebacteria bacterium]|nr:hypothetical protein [Candidatus Paceibacterota bacterium]MBP9700945.1 hypothetical protein [Candidatus Paceibacterota bacterium]
METVNPALLRGKDLKDFKVTQMTMVLKGDEDGKNFRPLGLYKNGSLAEVFTSQNKHNTHFSAIPVDILTDGKYFVLLDSRYDQPVAIIKEEEEKRKLMAVALEKLTPEERVLFGLPDPKSLKQ